MWFNRVHSTVLEAMRGRKNINPVPCPRLVALFQKRVDGDDASYLFNHWQDKTNGERMNHWLSVLLQNRELVSQLCAESLRRLPK
jgi:hypothetical protein